MEDKGRAMILKCVDCGSRQRGWSGRDGDVCEKCGGYMVPFGWASDLPPIIQPPVCQWDWKKMNKAQRLGRYECRCWNECHKLREEKEARIENTRGLWARLIAKLF